MQALFFNFITVFFFLFYFGENSYAQADSSPEKSGTAFFKPFEMGFYLENYRYAEPRLISHTGFLLGARGVLAWTHGPSAAAASSSILGDLAAGALNYDGALCDVNTNVCTPYKAKTYDILLRLTYRFEYLISETIQIFLGPGFRYIIDQGQGRGFYTRTGTYFFVPAGFSFYCNEYAFEFEYDFFLQGNMNSKLSEVNSTFGDITHSQPTGAAYKVTVSRLFPRAGVKPFNLSLYYEKRDVESSGPEELLVNQRPSGTFFREPKNFTEVLGLRASFLY